MTAIAVRKWFGKLEVGTLFIEPGSPWENGYCEPFNRKLRDNLLDVTARSLAGCERYGPQWSRQP